MPAGRSPETTARAGSEPRSTARPRGAYRLQLAQRADAACPRVRELHGDPALGRDARHGALPELLVRNLAPQAQAAVDAPDDGQHGHEAAHLGAVRLGEAVLQQGLCGQTDRQLADDGQGASRPRPPFSPVLPDSLTPPSLNTQHLKNHRAAGERAQAAPTPPAGAGPQLRDTACSCALMCLLMRPFHWPSECSVRSRATASSASVLLCVAVSEACGRALRLRSVDSESSTGRG